MSTLQKLYNGMYIVYDVEWNDVEYTHENYM